MRAATHGPVAVRPLRTESDDVAPADIDALPDASPAGSSDGNRPDVLVTLARAYEARRHAVRP